MHLVTLLAMVLMAAPALGKGSYQDAERAIRGNDLAKMKLLLGQDHGLVSSRNQYGWTLLHLAARLGREDIAELLLANGADVNARDRLGLTPLHDAANAGRTEVAALLLAHGADVNAKDTGGGTPMHWAIVRGYRDLAELLQQHGGKDEPRSARNAAGPLEETMNGADTRVPDATARGRACDTSQSGGTAVAVDSKTLDFICSMGNDLVFFTSRDRPIGSLSEIHDPGTQFAAAELSPRMMRLRGLLGKSGAGGNSSDSGSDAESSYQGVGVQFGETGLKPLGVTYESAGGSTLMGIGEDEIAQLFVRHPQLRLFAALRGSGKTNEIEDTGGGIRVRFVLEGPEHLASAPQAAAEGSPEQEASEWQSAEKANTPDAFQGFFRRFPQSPHIKTVSGTLRGRYWFRLTMPFENKNQVHREGVVVTVEGLSVARNLSLEDARRLGVINSSPASRGVNYQEKGVTFDYVYFEASGGGVVVGDQVVAPRDLLNSTIVLSADGKRLLTWDASGAREAPQPSTRPTIEKGQDGNYPCGPACPAP